MRNAGAERVGMDAVIAMSEILEEICIDISKDSIKLAKHAKRKTVKREDVRLAVKNI